MPPKTDRERLTHFVELIGAEPREAVFDDEGRLIELNLIDLNLPYLPNELTQFTALKFSKLRWKLHPISKTIWLVMK